jgi:hypothetical protein
MSNLEGSSNSANMLSSSRIGAKTGRNMISISCPQYSWENIIAKPLFDKF